MVTVLKPQCVLRLASFVASTNRAISGFEIMG